MLQLLHVAHGCVVLGLRSPVAQELDREKRELLWVFVEVAGHDRGQDAELLGDPGDDPEPDDVVVLRLFVIEVLVEGP